jgi:hypothetical protein
MTLIVIKKGLGTIRRTGDPLTVWHVVKGGRTVATFDTLTSAKLWVANRYGINNPNVKDW